MSILFSEIFEVFLTFFVKIYKNPLNMGKKETCEILLFF